MNNFKKLLASAMALTMVTTVVPANVTNVSAEASACDPLDNPETYTAYVENRNELAVFKAVFTEDVLADITMDDYVDEVTTRTFEGQTANMTVGELLTTSEALKYFALDTDYQATICGASVDDIAFASNLYTIATETANLASRVSAIISVVESAYSDEALEDITTSAQASAAISQISGWIQELTGTNFSNTPDTVNPERGAYADYLGDADRADYDSIIEDMELIIEDLSAAFDEDLMSAYATQLLTKLNADGWVNTTVVNGGSPVYSVKTPSQLEYRVAGRRSGTTYELTNLIEDIEDGTYVSGYSRYADDEDVMEIMDALDALLETSETLDDIVETLSEIGAADRLGSTSKATAMEVLTGGDYTRNTLYAEVFADVDADNIDDFVSGVDTPEYEILAELMDVVEQFYTVEVRNTGSRYYTRTIETDLYGNMATVFDAAGIDVIADTNGLFEIALDASGNETTQTEWEALVDRMAAVAEAYETVTTGVRGITVNNLNSSNAARVVEAYNALQLLTNTYNGNLTASEQSAVVAATTNIELLYAKALLEGIATDVVTGWVDLGNGNWDYYDENGTAFTGWVCTATDTWYYVSNGHMLRNAWVWRDATSAYYVGNDGVMWYGPATTPDGYAIDANGLWHA